MIEERSAADRELEDLLDRASTGYIVALHDGTVIRTNRTFASWIGRDVADLSQSMSFRQLLTVPCRIYFDTHLAPLLRMQGYFRGVALDISRVGREPLSAVVACTQESDRDGNPLLWRMTVADATDRRRYEQELLIAKRVAEEAIEAEQAARQLAEQASRAKEDILALVSHELRTPLSAILGWCQLLRKKSAELPEVHQGLEVIERNARMQARLVEDLLDMSRIVSGKLRLDVQRVNLSQAIEAALDTVTPAAEARHIRLQRVLDPGVFVSGDPVRIQQLFWNLLSNAAKFTSHGGTIRVVIERVDSHIEASVTDTGQGISADLLPHIFERFRQSDSSKARQTSGLGLGLSLVKQLVEMHGGSIEARSGGENQGSTFVVKLPVIAVSDEDGPRHHPQAALSLSTAPTQKTSLVGLRVLVVDDDVDAREILRQMLDASGAKVATAGSSEDALRLMDNFRPDVLISDIGMPNEDGYELIRRVRMRGDGLNIIPAVALTALSRLQDRTQALLAGFQIHLAKPVDAHELAVTIASLAKRPK